jgi:hypothetical protein
MSELALKYGQCMFSRKLRIFWLTCSRADLHPLAVEDVLYARRTSLSKADYYSAHLFISTLCHSVKNSHATGSFDLGGGLTGVPGTLSPEPTLSAEGRLPQPATASISGKASSEDRPHRLLNRFGSRQSNKPAENEEAESERDVGDGVRWITDSVFGTGNEEKSERIGADQADYLHNEV